LEKELNKKELKALVSLLEDEDFEVIKHVEGKIISIGSEVIPFLEKEWESSFNPTIQRKIEDLIHALQFDYVKFRLQEWVKNGASDLLEGVWIIATYQYPDLELSFLKKEIEQLYYEVWLDFKKDLHPYDQVKMINSAIFDKIKFRANTKNFHSPGNSMINVVLETKRGNPISLCVLYILIAQKLELPIFGVNLPNLFICTYKTQEHQFYINAFNKGLIFSKPDIENYVQQLHLNPIDLFFEPCRNEDIVKRVLRNLIISFEKIGDHQKSDEVKQLMHAIDNDYDLNQDS
jgi:regulator of sirC expression with transglutaminase-like and TPR domain